MGSGKFGLARIRKAAEAGRIRPGLPLRPARQVDFRNLHNTIAIPARAQIVKERAIGQPDDPGGLHFGFDIAQAEIADQLPAIVEIGAVIDPAIGSLGGFSHRRYFGRAERVAWRDLTRHRIVESAVVDPEKRVGRKRELVDRARLFGGRARKVFTQQIVSTKEEPATRQRSRSAAALKTAVKRAAKVGKAGEIIDEGTAANREGIAKVNSSVGVRCTFEEPAWSKARHKHG